MKRVIILTTSVVFVVAVLVFVVHKYQSNKQDYEKYKILPAFEFETIYNQIQSTANLPKYDGYVIQVFHPDCEICQKEAADLFEHKDQIRNILFQMLSPDSLQKIKDFALKQKLYNMDNFIFGHIDKEVFEKHFGNTLIPILFIYDSDRKLIDKTPIANSTIILKYFKN